MSVEQDDKTPDTFPAARITVLSNPGIWRPGDNPFLKMHFESLERLVDITPFTWARAILGHYDILHVHWLEYLILGPTWPIRMAKRLLFLLLVTRLTITRTPSVWTVHNESPHEATRPTERLLLALWRVTVTRKIVLSASSRFAQEQDSVLIRHGHYRPILSASDDRALSLDSSPFRLLLFGHLRPYKGVEELLGVIRADVPDDTLRLRVVGRPSTAQFGDELAGLARGLQNVELRMEFVTDEEIEGEIFNADLVVLPYRRMLNSGAALLALSANRPVLVPASPSMLELQTEVGTEWVHTFSPPFNSEDLARAIAAAAARTSHRPDLVNRDWGLISRQHLAVYVGLVGQRGLKRPRRLRAEGSSTGQERFR